MQGYVNMIDGTFTIHRIVTSFLHVNSSSNSVQTPGLRGVDLKTFCFSVEESCCMVS